MTDTPKYPPVNSADIAKQAAGALGMDGTQESELYGELSQMPNGPVKSAMERLAAKAGTKRRTRVVFDVDDVLWPLNRYTSWYAAVDYDRIVTYYPDDNPLLDGFEKARVLDAYKFHRLHARIPFYPEAKYLTILAADPRVDLHVCSNSITETSRSDKQRCLEQLLGPEALARTTLHLPLVHMKDTREKAMPENIGILIDDSPYNAVNSGARHILMPRRPWNQSEQGLAVLGPVIDRVVFYDGLGKCFNMISGLIA